MIVALKTQFCAVASIASGRPWFRTYESPRLSSELRSPDSFAMFTGYPADSRPSQRYGKLQGRPTRSQNRLTERTTYRELFPIIAIAIVDAEG